MKRTIEQRVTALEDTLTRVIEGLTAREIQLLATARHDDLRKAKAVREREEEVLSATDSEPPLPSGSETWNFVGAVKVPALVLCGFCGIADGDPRENGNTAFVAMGPDVGICDDCIQICAEIFAERKAIQKALERKDISPVFVKP